MTGVAEKRLELGSLAFAVLCPSDCCYCLQQTTWADSCLLTIYATV